MALESLVNLIFHCACVLVDFFVQEFRSRLQLLHNEHTVAVKQDASPLVHRIPPFETSPPLVLLKVLFNHMINDLVKDIFYWRCDILPCFLALQDFSQGVSLPNNAIRRVVFIPLEVFSIRFVLGYRDYRFLFVPSSFRIGIFRFEFIEVWQFEHVLEFILYIRNKVEVCTEGSSLPDD